MPIDMTKDIFERIYKVTDNKPAYKRKAALRLAEILIREGKYGESRKYVYYILSQNPDDRETLRLLREIEGKK